MRLTAICIVGLVFTGCDVRTESEIKAPLSKTNESANIAVEAGDVVQAADATAVSALDGPGLAAFVKQRSGNVVLVDFWATWCLACREGFPAVVDLSKKYQSQGLIVTSIAIDDADQLPAIETFLTEQSAPRPAFLSSYGGTDGRAMEAFQIQSGTLPTLKLYDRSGKLRYTFGDGEPFEHDEVEVSVRQLLNEQSPATHVDGHADTAVPLR